MEAIVFDNDVVSQCALFNRCADFLQNVSDRDYPGRYNFDSRIECLDIDYYERMVCGGNPDNTMDAVIGVCDCKNDKRKTFHRLMLIEFRMDYVSTNNLSVTQMVRKVGHTKNLLGGGVQIDTNSFFIFDDNISEQAKRWFANKSNEGGAFKNCVAWSVNDFCTNVVSYDDLPYTPLFDKEKIVTDICSLIDKGKWNSVFRTFRYWLDKIKFYQYVNNREAECLSEAVCEAWDFFKSKNPSLNDDEEIERLILEEDIETIIR